MILTVPVLFSWSRELDMMAMKVFIDELVCKQWVFSVGRAVLFKENFCWEGSTAFQYISGGVAGQITVTREVRVPEMLAKPTLCEPLSGLIHSNPDISLITQPTAVNMAPAS